MSAEETFHRPSVVKAIEQWHAGTLGELETHRLKDLLRDDPAARQLFVEFGDMLAALDFAVEPESLASRNAFAQWALDAHSSHWSASRRWGLGAILLASTLCLALVVGFFFAPRQTQVPAGPFAAVITQILPVPSGSSLIDSNGEVENPVAETLFQVGQQFQPGEELVIPGAEQYLRLSLRQGVELLVEGPATLVFMAENAVELKRGRLVGTVSPAGTGFTVHLPQGEVQDLGTVFGVSANEGDSSVTVLSGKVTCRLFRPGHPLPEPILIQSGESARLDPERAAPVLLTEADESLSRITGIHSGILQATGDAQFSSAPPPLPKGRRSIDAGKILVFQESRQIPLSWDPVNKSFFHSDDTAFPEENILLKQASPDHSSSLLNNIQESGSIDVDSYLVSMSSLGQGTLVLNGTLTFQNEILAVFTSRDGLVATDHFSSTPEFAVQWKEQSPGARGSHEAGDEVVIMKDQHTLKMTLQASGAGDQLRILVRAGTRQP